MIDQPAQMPCPGSTPARDRWSEARMTSIFEEVRAERAALLKSISALHPVALDRPGVVGEWSIKDVLAHIAGWQGWMARALPIRLERGELPDELRVTEHNTGD